MNLETTQNFARLVNQTAANLADQGQGAWGSRKVFLSDVRQALRLHQPFFNDLVIAADRLDLIIACRADCTSDLPIEKVKLSECGNRHFVKV